MKPGDFVIVNSTTPGQLIEHVERDPRWKRAGWIVRPFVLSFGDGSGFSFVPEEMIRPMPAAEVERWRRTPGLYERYRSTPLSRGEPA